MEYDVNPIFLSSMATIQYVPRLPLLSLGEDTARLNPKLSTSPIARKINLVGQTKLIILRDSKGNDTYCIVAIEDKKMGFISYCLSLSLYIMSSYLKRYSVLDELNTLDASRSRSMCGVIVVDAESFWSTCHGRDAYIHDHCLGYRHTFALLYQLLGSNLFIHRNTCYHERSH